MPNVPDSSDPKSEPRKRRVEKRPRRRRALGSSNPDEPDTAAEQRRQNEEIQTR